MVLGSNYVRIVRPHPKGHDPEVENHYSNTDIENNVCNTQSSQDKPDRFYHNSVCGADDFFSGCWLSSGEWELLSLSTDHPVELEM